MPPKKKAKGSGPGARRSPLGLMSEEEKICAHLSLKHKPDKVAAEMTALGYEIKLDEIKSMLGRKHVKDYLSQYRHAFLKEMARHEVHNLSRHSVTREDVVGRLLTLALVPPEETRGTIDGQVQALNTVTEILGLKFSPRDADSFFRDRTVEELDNYARYGNFSPNPDQIVADASAPAKPISE